MDDVRSAILGARGNLCLLLSPPCKVVIVTFLHLTRSVDSIYPESRHLCLKLLHSRCLLSFPMSTELLSRNLLLQPQPLNIHTKVMPGHQRRQIHELPAAKMLFGVGRRYVRAGHFTPHDRPNPLPTLWMST